MGLFDSFKKQAKEIVGGEPASEEPKEEITQAEQTTNEEEPTSEDVSRETSSDVVVEEVEEEVPEEVESVTMRTYADKKPVTHVVGSTKVIAILNQKGGVGKSTTTINLGAALGARNKQVLLIDLDPQGNTSSGLAIEKNKLEACIYDVIIGNTKSSTHSKEASYPYEKEEEPIGLTDIIIPDVCEGLDIAPSTINLAGAEVELVSEMARENRLKEAIAPLRGRYDYILIDCPPSLGLLTVNALCAADKLLIPIQCEFYALEGVSKLLDSMSRVKSRLNPGLDIFGVLLTMYDGRTTLSRQVAEEVRNYFGKKVFDVVIPRSVKISEAPSYGQPITEYDPSGKGAQAYNALAEEVIQRG